MDVFDDIIKPELKTDRFQGVLTGIVKENWNKEHPGYVKVEYFYGPKGINISDWMPVAMPYTATEAGFYFFPEVESEVVIAFIQGDWHSPVVIASLWNEKTKLPAGTAVEKNNIKKIKTKAGHEIIFGGEEKKESIQINTPGKMSISLDDEAQEIKITAKEAKNSIKLSAKDGKMEISSDKKIEIKVGGNTLISLEAQKINLKAANIEGKASGGMKLEGQTVSIKGSSIEENANGSMKVQSSGVMQIKGAMVKIN